MYIYIYKKEIYDTIIYIYIYTYIYVYTNVNMYLFIPLSALPYWALPTHEAPYSRKKRRLYLPSPSPLALSLSSRGVQHVPIPTPSHEEP